MAVEEPFGACPRAIDSLVRWLPILDARLADFSMCWLGGTQLVVYSVTRQRGVRLEEAETFVHDLPATLIGMTDAAVAAVLIRGALLAALGWVEAQAPGDAATARRSALIGSVVYGLAAKWAANNAREANERNSIAYSA